MKFFVATSLLIIPIQFLGCASTSNKSSEKPPESPTQSSRQISSVEIEYVLGRDHHRFLAEAKENATMAHNYLDHQVISHGAVDKAKYLNFLEKASSFVTQATPGYSSQSFCRSPYTVTVKIGKDTRAIRGCRSADDGNLSRLVRDGEFLLYSKN